MIQAVKDFLKGTFFLLLAGWLCFIFFQAKSLDPASLPDHDFLPEIEKMMAEKRFQEAEQLCCDVVGMNLPNAAAANQKIVECRSARRSWKNNLWETARGFLTGEGKNSAAVAGAVLSDLCIYGDLRDLGVQAYNKLRGRPVDKVIVAISGAGVLAELTGVAGSAPALVKQLYRAGALSSRMVDCLRQAVLRFTSKGTLTAADKKLFKDLEDVTAFHGFPRSRQLLRGIETPEELSAAVKIGKQAPEVPWLLACAAPADCGKLLVRYGDGGLFLLKRAVRKGHAGAELLRKIRIVKWSAKNILRGRFHDMLLYSAIEKKAFACTLFWCSGALGLISLFFFCRAALSGGLFLRRRQKTHSKAAVGE